MLSESWKNTFKMASEDTKKMVLKSTENMKLSAFFSGFWGLNNPSYFFMPLFNI